MELPEGFPRKEGSHLRETSKSVPAELFTVVGLALFAAEDEVLVFLAHFQPQTSGDSCHQGGGSHTWAYAARHKELITVASGRR